ncbi:CocE/NonD family hydrolase [Shewanella rhizosphaerae]|uniref:CocE/NonD family hydrolase n=1 Tax=Shewanella rhizosphaerae TaxID=2864207 RepID=UPI001C65CBC5|nr:CocE/NonD family hydrolase [Shewanella rhizosphaerae]QYK12020.1 CocE/NonD family hydrolase [Shewanella rhizosphaerae]
MEQVRGKSQRAACWLAAGLLTISAGVTPVVIAAAESATNQPGQSEQALSEQALSENSKVSSFGHYQGYSQERFDGWVTNSEYITTRDGTKLAADISRPANHGVVTKEKLPVLWTYSRYHREFEPGVTNIDDDAILQRLARHGYVIASVNVRGGGASFGRYQGLFSAPETRDAYDVIDWLSKRPYSSGNIGMYGLSYMGITQYMAASTKHPALKAITPENGYFSLYDAVRRGGIMRQDLVESWGKGTQYLDKVRKPTPVDADTDGTLAAAAVKEHATNFDPIAPLAAAKLRDDTAPEFDWYKDMPSAINTALNESGVAIYHFGSWHDPYTTDTLVHFENYHGPQKMAFGPWSHVTNNEAEKLERDKVYGAEFQRWFDYWLKGIKNGVMDGPQIHVAEVDSMRKQWQWISLPQFPLQKARTSFYFGESSAKSDLVTDHLLSTQAPVLSTQKPDASALLAYQVNDLTTTGTATRWDSNYGTQVNYPDMTANDGHSLTFTTAPLDKDMVIAGIPLVKLFVSASTPDADVYALLEEVEADGSSNYITEGNLRLSLRKQHKAPWNNLDIPWHRALKEDQQLLTPGEVVEADFDIMPVVYRINKGNRLRVAIMGGDKDNMEAPPYPEAQLSLSVGGAQASQIALPLM